MAPLSMIPKALRGDDAQAAEAALVQDIAGGDRQALAALYRRYHRRLARFLSRLTWRADVIDEAINDAFWVVWQSAGRFRGEARVSTWIMGIGYRCALKALRGHDRHGGEGLDDEPPAAGGDDPTRAYETGDWVAKALQRLVPEQRATLELAYGAGHSLEEIAAIMDCPASTVKARLFHARVKLRNLLPALAGAAGAAAAPPAPGAQGPVDDAADRDEPNPR